MAFNTGNPIGSTDPRDFSDNSENLDRAVNNTASATWTDRLGNTRTSLAGQIGYIGTGAGGAIEDYAAGQELTTFSTIIRYSGEFYRPAAGVSLPYTTTATTPDVDANLVSVGDATLRQDLAGDPSAGNGAALVNGAAIYVGSVAELEGLSVSIGANVKTLGYYTPGDGGGNEYEIVPGGTGTSDGGSFINLDNGLQARGLFGASVDVRQFGADSTSASSDHLAIKAAIAYGNVVKIIPEPGTSFLYDADDPALAHDDLKIVGPGSDSTAITMGGNSLYGGYQFLTQNGPASNVSVIGLGFYGQDIKPASISPVNDGVDGAIPAQLIDLSGCNNVKVHDVKITEWHHYYNLDDRPCILNVTDCTDVLVDAYYTRNCFGEQIEARNTIRGRFYRGDCVNTITSGIGGAMITALNQMPTNESGDVGTSRDNRIIDWQVQGATGSSIDVGGIGLIVSNIRMFNCRGGLNLSNEQFDVSVINAHDDVVISNIVAVSDGNSGGSGLNIPARVKKITVNNVLLSNVNGEALRIDDVENLTISNAIVQDCTGTQSILFDGYTDGSGNRQGILKASNIVSKGFNASNGVILRNFKRASISSLDVSDTAISLGVNDKIFFSDLNVQNYEDYNSYAMQIQDGNHGKISIRGFDIDPGDSGTFSLSHIRGGAGASVESMWLSDGEFGQTTGTYSVELTGLTKMHFVNVEHSSERLVFQGIRDATLTAASKPGANTWRTPIDLGNGYIFVSSAGKVRFTTDYPTGDTDGELVADQVV